MRRVRVKPGKTQSIFGMIVGIIFLLIGLFIVIPNFGAFGILWTAIVAVMIGTNAYNAFSDKGVSSHEIIIDDSDETTDSATNRLMQLRNMYDSGLITSEEYENKKKEILDEL